MQIAGHFALCGCLAVVLSAAGAPGPESAVQLTVVDPLQPIYGPADIREKGTVLRLVGPRGGACSAQAVATGAGKAGLTATVSALTCGDKTLPATAVKVRFARKEQNYQIGALDTRAGLEQHYLEAYYDALFPTAAGGEELTPVWVTVEIPPTAAPGLYRGTLTVAGAKVPAELTVCDWRCPPPGEWSEHIGIVPGHETLAAYYGVSCWSEAHWKLIEQELALLGTLGCDDLWIHVLANGGMGKGFAMVRFRQKGNALVPDFTIVDRYLDLYRKYVGRPQYVLLNVWDSEPDARGGRTPALVIRGQLVSGALTSIPLARAEGGGAVWKPLLDGLRKRIVERGWDEKSITLAVAGDQRPAEATVKAYQEWAPYARWAIWTHGRGEKPLQTYKKGEPLVYSTGMPIGYYVSPNTPHYSTWVRGGTAGTKGKITDGIQGGWNLERPVFTSARNDLHKYAAPSQWRTFGNGAMVGGYGMDDEAGGFAFVWLDFWSLPAMKEQVFLGRWCDIMSRHNSPSVIEPGADGPVASVRYEMLREGLQETEARVQIERALVNKSISDPLAKEARALLEEMVQVRYDHGKVQGGHAGGNLGIPSRMWGVEPYPQWQQTLARLYDIAGQVQATTRSK